MNNPIVSWLLLAISTISIFSDVARASTSAQCLGIDQRSLLLELRNNLIFNASESSKLVQWDRSADSWSGVTCEDGLVVGLDLSVESISSGIDSSSSLFKLVFLRSLNLAFNDFNYMAIPSGLVNLSRLEHLNLSFAGFTGQIPAKLSRLRKLRTLDLTCSFSSPALLKLDKPSLRSLIGDLGELRELYLDGVNVSTEGSEWCDALSSSVPKLEVLSMSDCSLSGPIDASLMSLANLSVIQLGGNNLSTTVPSFLANFSSLKTLHLGDCDLQGEFPQKVFQVKTLKNLVLSRNELLQVSLPDFLEDNSLETLVMPSTNILGRIPDSIDSWAWWAKLRGQRDEEEIIGGPLSLADPLLLLARRPPSSEGQEASKLQREPDQQPLLPIEARRSPISRCCAAHIRQPLLARNRAQLAAVSSCSAVQLLVWPPCITMVVA
ncbi:receptor-like protein 6 [Eucalyptus grandis]|uniref:receptor-like protein 6 n=1 Tax=Eucalyptus grandis TaxID=71139 RepID=UPI00192E8E0A|nr:receptor-like protein 6 [Eucalyptus grandis]